MEKLEIMKIGEILRLNKLMLSCRDIAKIIPCSKTTVSDVLRNCKNLGLDYSNFEKIGIEEFEKLYRKKNSSAQDEKNDNEIDWDSIHKRLTNESNITLQYIWLEEYKFEHADEYSYSHFCKKNKNGKNNLCKNK